MPPRTFHVQEITDKTATFVWSHPRTGQPHDYLITIRNNENKEEREYPAVAYPGTEFVVWYLEQSTPYTAFLNARRNGVKSTNMSIGFRTGKYR